jgi:hypothetical protein
MPKMLIRNPLQIQEILQERAKIHFSAHKDLHKSKNPSGCSMSGALCRTRFQAGREIRFRALPAACPPCRRSENRESNDADQGLFTSHYFAHGAFVHWFSFGHNEDRDVSVRDDTTKRSSFRTEAAFESSLPGRQVARLCSSIHQVASLFSCLSSPPCSRSLAAESGYAASLAATPSCQWNQN